MKRIVFLMLGLALLTSFSGCLCSPWPGAKPYGYGSCGPGGYGIQPGTVGPNGTFAPQGTYQNTYGAFQAGVPVATPFAVAPQPAYPTMAFGPLETLPTY